MPEHRIRLALAWSRLVADQPPRRVDLPIVWTEDDARGPFDLVRQFRWPPIDEARQAVALELDDVPGLRALQFAGRDLLEGAICGTGPRRILLIRSPDRQVVQLGVDLAGVVADRPWGRIALVILDREDDGRVSGAGPPRHNG